MIQNIKISSGSLYIKFSNKTEDNFPNIWLRDHAQDELNWDSRSNQRKTFTALIDDNIHIKSASIIENGKFLSIYWSDLKDSVKYSSEFLLNNSLSKNTISKKLKLWKRDSVDKETFINFENVFTNDGEFI